MASDGRRVRQGIRLVRGPLPPTLQAARCYLFCIAGNGDLLLYQRAMQDRDLAVGLFDMGIEIKHPMLVQDHRLSVRCAGEMFLAQRTGATIAGMLVSRTSGHFRPGGATVASLRAAAAAMGIAQSRVFIVGDEPPSQ